MSEAMTKGDRDALIGLVRKNAKLAKADTDQRKAILRAEIEDLITAQVRSEEVLKASTIKRLKEAVQAANDEARATYEATGRPGKYAPSASVAWSSRSGEFIDPERRNELRRLAERRLDALTTKSKHEIDKAAVQQEAALIAGSLDSNEARAILGRLPTPDEMMPSLSLDDLGVKGYQPSEGAAAALLTPSTTTDLKRRKVFRAIENNPGASNRSIGELTQTDHKTVGKYRAERGEIPIEAGEIPTDGDGGDGRG